MKMANENKFAKDSPAEATTLDSTLKALLYKLQNTPLQLDKIEEECVAIREKVSSTSADIKKENITSLIQFLEKITVRINEQLFSLLEALIMKQDNPDAFLSELLFSQDEQSRKLAANLLDQKGTPASEKTIEKLLGAEAAKILSPYLEYTRATHQDLLYLIPIIGKPLPILESLSHCENICGDHLIKEVISKLGWKKINYGLSVKRYVGLTINGSLPLFVSDSEAKLFESSVNTKRVSNFYLFTAHGGLPVEISTNDEGDKPVNLFRSYNLAHANLLQEILDVAPLTIEKVRRILEQMDSIVDDFIKLFSSYSDECSILPEVYEKIKIKVVTDLSKETSESHLSADVTRLVQMFEDPRSVGEVHTIHGLKRYLHQKGLQLGFKLVDQSRSPNQSVNLVLATSNRILSVIKNINFANFEAKTEEELSITKIPYPVKIVLEGFERQLLHGLTNFPSVNIFLYGNEVHYFVWFRNHPVFIRIDYSPPLQGGMIDLKYFGVSNYEIADHPNIYLDAIRFLFQYLEFYVKLEGTHIHARYDKERALDLDQLCERVKYLFCLVPYLMDLDWVIGSLNLPSDSKKKVAAAWAHLFKHWGVLPLDKLISKDRLGILQDVLLTPEGEYELVWSGDGDYQDRFTIKADKGFFDSIYESVNNIGIKIPKFSEENVNLPGQIYWEDHLLNYLREAVNTGEIIKSPAGFENASKELFQKVHEASWFAEIISQRGKELECAVAVAKVIIPLEQTLRFQSTGTLENFKVQAASLPLVGDSLNIYVLRDNNAIIRLAFFVTGNSLHQKRKSENESWQVNAEHSPVKLMSLLRSNNYTVIGSEPNVESLQEEVQKVLDELQLPHKQVADIITPGEKLVMGLRASPGRATGRVILGSSGRLPEDFDGHIFVASSVSPDENTILFHSAGIVATGGGILSHAGLIATQFNKPAIIISGKWIQKPDGSLVLFYQTLEYLIEHKKEKNLNVSLYYDLHEVDHQMQDGDLVVLDANEGTLEVLGQESDTIALFEELKSLGKINEEISKVSDAKELLVLRGKKLHTRHQIEKLFRRISEPVLVRYSVQEILIGNFLDGNKSSPEEKSYLLNLILQNDKCDKVAGAYLLQTISEIENKFLTAFSKAEQIIPIAKYPFEVVMPRLEALRVYTLMKGVAASIGTSLSKEIKLEMSDIDKINEISIHRLHELRNHLFEKIEELTGQIEKKEFLRHLFRQISRIDLLLHTSSKEQLEIEKLKKSFQLEDNILCEKLSNKFILKPREGTLELSPLIGWKAANLAELEMLGVEGFIPPWFVVTDKAFQTVLESQINESFSVSGDNIAKGTRLRDAIDKILSRADINNREKALHIRNLWQTISLPDEIKSEVIQAYREIEKEFCSSVPINEKTEKLYVAIRSSSCEEDAEIAARAGEFETYLFISGEDLLIEYLKRTWSGLWTERAIHNRTIFANKLVQATGGVIVQRIVWSRVSGVLQTINVPRKDLKEIVINAGLGLGEGVVSGAVAADQIIVSKEGNLEKGPLNFNYITADKKEQVVFNKRAGYGTVLTPTLYHQRFRAALEYVELCELVSVASRLEAAYGYPLDIEFGIEGTKLWILQVRPVATFLPAFKETINNYPLLKKNNENIREKLK